jgi:drug/metabolite transporter (DMT)-like permease
LARTPIRRSDVQKRREALYGIIDHCLFAQPPHLRMDTASLVRLVLLAAIWGASFLFMRMGAPVLGPAFLIELRVGLAALFLLLVGLISKKRLSMRGNWTHYFVLGLFNSALPFLLFGFAARTLSASSLSILNATSPIWGALIGAGWTRSALPPRVLIGMALGLIGVAILVGLDLGKSHEGTVPAILMGLGAAFSYGIATNYARSAKKIDPFANAHGSMWAAALIVAPAVPFFSNAVVPTPTIAASVLGLGVLCTGVAYLLYFRLIKDLGAASALTVTFLIPAFGVLWGHLILHEEIGWNTLIGAGVIVIGTALVTGFSPRALLASCGLPRGSRNAEACAASPSRL